MHHRGMESGSLRLRRSQTILGLWLLALGAVTLALPQDAQAQRVRRKYKDRVNVYQPKPVLQKGRVELAPRFGISFNDPVNRSFRVGLNANYHFTERFFIGGIFDWYDFGTALGGPTSLFEDVLNETRTQVDSAVVNWFGGGEVGFVPLYGKFALFNSGVIYYDFAVTLGAGAMSAESILLTSPSTTFGLTWSASTRLFLTRWLALNLEFRDLMFGATLQSGSGVFTNVLTFAGGLSFYLPTGFKYEDPVYAAEDEEDDE